MTESILNTIKKMLGIEKDCNSFDADIIIWINSSLSSLFDIGGCKIDFSIDGESETWDELLEEDILSLKDVKTYIYIKVRLGFDPPSSSFVLDSYDKMLKEIEWRINVRKEFEVN